MRGWVAVWLLAVALTGCGASGDGADPVQAGMVAVTVQGQGGAHRFEVELADTVAEQAQGLKFRTDLKPDGGMLFAPYPPDGGPPRATTFWMKDTPSPLDIVFIRPDRTIARIAENTVPFAEAPVASGEPVVAVLEVPGGRMAELGVAEGDRVEWSSPTR